VSTVKAHYKEKKKGSLFAVAALMLMAIVITGLGLAFGIYAVINNVNFTVMRAQIPGVVFAAVVLFLGVRYLISTIKLAGKIKDQRFTWKNFRKSVKTEASKSQA
jgi:hypothetical protein